MHRKLLGNDHPEVANSLDNLAVLLRQQNRLDAAEPLTREALSIREQVLGPEHPHTVSSIYELASIQRERRNFDQALTLFNRVYELDKKTLGENHHYVGLDLREIGLTYLRMKAFVEARRSYEQSIEILQQVLPPDHADILVAMTGIGNTYLQAGDYERAEPIIRDVVNRRIATLGEDSWWTGITKSLLGECLMRMGRNDEAEKELVDGYTTLREAGGPQEAALRRLVEFYETVEQPDRAAEYKDFLDALDT
jgi:tetratricopeptide (TPR) repeat protein